MNELKKADEIVKALRWLAKDTEFVFAAENLNDAADLIESMQSEVTKWKERHNQAALNFQQENRENAKLQAQLAASQRREKAAVEDINLLEDCGVCKHHDLDSCDLAGTECHFEWRGPQEAERVRGVCGTTSLPCSGCAPVCEHERPQEAEKGKADGN